MENIGFFVEDDVEVPTSAERTDGRFDAEALPGYDLDPHWTIRALRIGYGDARGIEFLVRWINHFVLGRGLVMKHEMARGCTYLLREVNPELHADGVRPALFVDWHLGVDN